MIKVIGQADQRTIEQLERCVAAEEGSIGLLMADNHVGYSMPIGGVVGYQNHISPSGVGYDIACGNMAVRTTLRAGDISQAEMVRIADEVQNRISFGIGRKNNEPVDSAVFDLIEKSPVIEQRVLLQSARSQLGTVGSGNHYVDILEDEEGLLWIGVHFGSRGFGHKTASGFMNIAQGGRWEDKSHDGEMDAPPLLLDIHKPSGQDYIAAMHIAGNFAYEGRRAVVRKVLEILGAEATFTVHNHHNFAWREDHEGEELWVVRKGATPAFPGQQGFVGGSMGDISVILEGVDSDASREALYSTVHGAGRVMSRTQAAGKQKWTKGGWRCGNYRNCAFLGRTQDFERGKQDELPRCPMCQAKMHLQRREMTRLGDGLVDFPLEQQKLVDRGIILRGAGADEAPPVYRALQSVLDAHVGTIKILHTLQPRVVVMAGSDEHDPWKDG